MEADDSHLDPRIYKELEKLNKASEEINCLEVELDNARASFRQILNESITQLNSLSKRLGGSVDKARPYYDARKKALEAQLCTQNAAIKFEKACSQLAAAKEMVNLAEQGYFKMGQTFDPAWQEMLNHSTIRVNDAEKERLECEVAHRMTTFIFNDSEQNVRRMQKEFKRSISKSKPYFELKARYNQTMEEQKKKVERLEASVSKSKYIYSETLRSLEMISDEIHKKRGTQRRHRRKVARSKRPDQIYHPLMDASEVITEEVSSPSPDEKLIRELDALHFQNDVDSSHGNKTSNHIKKDKKIQVHTNNDAPRPNKYKMPDEAGDAKDSQKHLTTRPFTSSLIECASAPTKRRIDANTESPKLKILSIEQSWNELLSPMKLMSSGTLFRAPINPLRVENLSTERVNQKLCMSGYTFTEDELIQKTSEDRGLKIKGINKNAVKNNFKVKDKTYKANEKNRKVTKSSGDQSSFHCQNNDQKNLSSEESVKIQNIFTPTTRASPGPETLKPKGYFDLKDPSRDSSPEKQDALQQTSYSFLVDRKDALQQTSFQSLGKKDFCPRRVSWGRGFITTEINDSENSKKPPQSVSHHHKVKDDQLWKFPFHPLTHNSQVIPSYNVIFDSQVIQRSKTSPSPTLFQLPHGKMEQNQAEANSETESIASSLNSASLLDDDQVESLMMETSQYHSFLSQMDAQESECFGRLTLPNKLHYLKNLVNFDPIWLDGYDDNDDEIGNHNRANVSRTSLFDEQIFRSDDAEEELVDDGCNNENFREHFSDNECGVNKSNENEDQYIDHFDSTLTNLKKVTFEDVGARKSLPLSRSDGFNDSESVESNSRILNLNNKTTPRMANKNKN